MASPKFVEVIGHLAIPAKGPSAVFAIIYTVSFILHVVQISKYKTWSCLWIVPCACIIFIAGYICREYNAHHQKDDGTSAPDQGLLLSGALIFTAGLYPLLIRMLMTLPNGLSCSYWLPLVMFNLYFCAIISITSQGAASLFNTTASLSTVQSGVALLKASIIMQLCFILAFVVILATFHRRHVAAKPSNAAQTKQLRIVMATLYILAGLILVRNIFRTVQIFSHAGSSAWRNETFFWIFDATPMVVATLLLNATRPAEWLNRDLTNVRDDNE